MKNIVLTIHHKHGDEFIICDLKKYQLIKKELVAYPTPISVDLYEDGEIVQVEAKCGSIEFLLGCTTTKLRGTFVQHLSFHTFLGGSMCSNESGSISAFFSIN